MSSSSFSDVVQAVAEERMFQDEKHGSIQESPHEIGSWVLLIEAELNEVKSALIKGGFGRDSYRSELIQVAALCFAALEQHGLISKSTRRGI